MANKTEWPKGRFQFLVNIGGKEFFFHEISGLSTETSDLEYRKGNSRNFSPTKLPGLQKHGQVTMKRGVFKNDQDLWSDLEYARMNGIKQTATISMVDETNQVVMTWQLTNAVPLKIQSVDLNADGNEVVIETLELSHEGFTVSSS